MGKLFYFMTWLGVTAALSVGAWYTGAYVGRALANFNSKTSLEPRFQAGQCVMEKDRGDREPWESRLVHPVRILQVGLMSYRTCSDKESCKIFISGIDTMLIDGKLGFLRQDEYEVVDCEEAGL